MPEWVGEAVLGAITAAVGYLGKSVHDDLKSRRASRQAAVEQLRLLKSLLDESWSIFQSQNYQARTLMELVKMNHADTFQPGLGFDETFRRLYPSFSEEERELHALIRSTSINSMHRLNTELRAWIRTNDVYKREPQPSPGRIALARELQMLELHLNQWHDKYEALIPSD